MKKTIMMILIALFLTVIGFLCFAQNTICNPIDLSYRFQLDGASRREAADPTIVLFKGNYYLFASKSGGYWYASDLINWNYVQTSKMPVEDYAPTAVVINDAIYFMASNYSGNSEWAAIDLGALYDVYALQINFAEHNTKTYGRKENLYHQYMIEFSNDNITWAVLADNSQNKSDNTHNYLPLLARTPDIRSINVSAAPAGLLTVMLYHPFSRV